MNALHAFPHLCIMDSVGLPHSVGMAREQDSGSNQCIHVQVCGETQNSDYKVLGAAVSLPQSTVALSV